ncbi:MAG: hypothetical protein ABEJ61_09720 [Haloferacaceae archaeon]
MRIEVEGRARTGRAVDLDGAVRPERLHRAVVDGTVDGVTVDCPDPGLVHERVGVIRDGMDLWLRGALAAAARSLGEEAPASEALTAARAQLADADAPAVGLAAARRRLAAAGEEEARLRERVATLRGRVQALDDAGEEAARAEAAEELAAATRELTDVETERIAAQQRLDRLTHEVRDARDRRERRLELQDRVANLERAVREELATAVYDRFRAAVAALPGAGEAGAAPGEYEGDPTTAALAVVRVADVGAPVVVATDRLGDAAAAATRLDAPVVRP